MQPQPVVRSFAVGFSPISVFFPVQRTGPANTSCDNRKICHSCKLICYVNSLLLLTMRLGWAGQVMLEFHWRERLGGGLPVRGRMVSSLQVILLLFVIPFYFNCCVFLQGFSPRKPPLPPSLLSLPPSLGLLSGLSGFSLHILLEFAPPLSLLL